MPRQVGSPQAQHRTTFRYDAFVATVYIETTIPSYYFETRSEPRIVAWHETTRHWWNEIRRQYEPVTSNVVIQELMQAPEAYASHD